MLWASRGAQSSCVAAIHRPGPSQAWDRAETNPSPQATVREGGRSLPPELAPTTAFVGTATGCRSPPLRPPGCSWDQGAGIPAPETPKEPGSLESQAKALTFNRRLPSPGAATIPDSQGHARPFPPHFHIWIRHLRLLGMGLCTNAMCSAPPHPNTLCKATSKPSAPQTTLAGQHCPQVQR